MVDRRTASPLQDQRVLQGREETSAHQHLLEIAQGPKTCMAHAFLEKTFHHHLPDRQEDNYAQGEINAPHHRYRFES